jgi:tetratricopeptide (TPR) repeat protein
MKLVKILLIFFFCNLTSIVLAKANFFAKAKDLYDKKKYEDSKFLFQRNIVFNPKDAKSYLYLSKIYKIEENDKELEKNVNTTLLLEPNNEEAMYMLMEIELERSNFSKVSELTETFKLICSSLCDKTASVKERLKNFEAKDES